jgi:DNA-binding transcriptional LysR family regulator
MNNVSFNLRNLDLNLLVVFDVLMQERSVSKAAERVFLSQPAMSNALNRLRRMLNDPVLARTSNGMEPTPRARELEGPIRSLLAQMEWQLKIRTSFDPATTQNHFIIATTDYSENVVLPHLTRLFSQQAPNAVLETRALGHELPEKALERGEIQLILGVEDYITATGRLRSHPWISDRLVCLVQQEHPRLQGQQISLKQFLNARHVYPSPLGVKTNIVETWLAKQNCARHVSVTTRSYLAAALIVQKTDYVLSLPERVANSMVKLFGLKTLQPPKGFPAFKINIIWHPLYENEPSLLWLLEQVKTLEGRID